MGKQAWTNKPKDEKLMDSLPKIFKYNHDNVSINS